MQKTILITGSTDGIGLETAKMLAADGHRVLLHGRNPVKLKQAESSVIELAPGADVETYEADLSSMPAVEALAAAITQRHDRLDVLINNAGIFKTGEPVTADGLDVRFAVNTLAPWLLTQRLLPLLDGAARIINLSSAAQAPVDPRALAGQVRVDDDFNAYAQSKLAITMWSRQLAGVLGADGPLVVAVNPGSLLASKMVTEGFGVAGNDLGIGAEILVRAALSEEFATASGLYYDNDNQRFADPHPDALDEQKSAGIVQVIESTLERLADSLAKRPGTAG